MSEEDTEPELLEETGVEDAGFDDDAEEVVEVGFGCVVGAEVGVGSDGCPESGFPFRFAEGVLGLLSVEDVCTGVEGFGA